jgi:hypothetical protein
VRTEAAGTFCPALVNNAATGHHALTTAIVWWPLGSSSAAAYFTFAYRLFFRSTDDGLGFDNQP